MYRNHLDENAGMLFIFPRPSAAQFWMKNTVIPLDMLFADSNGKVVGIVANAQPYSEALLGGFNGTLYVLEVNAGYAATASYRGRRPARIPGFQSPYRSLNWHGFVVLAWL